MLFGIICLVGMVVDGFIPLVDVRVSVVMLMDMSVYQIAVPVLVGVNMGMLVGVLQANGVFHHQNSCNDHNAEAHIELNTGPLISIPGASAHSVVHGKASC